MFRLRLMHWLIKVIINLLRMRSSFCLDSVSSAKQISLSPLNNSSSKQLYSFSKDDRFKKATIYCDSIYNIPSTFRKSGAGFGYGKKSDFTKDLTCSPSSSKYFLKTIFDNNRTSKKGFSMYQSRQKLPQRGHIPLDPLKVPGPDQYNNLKLSKGFTFTMRKKLPVLDRTRSIEVQNNNPGAGRYQNPQALSPVGRYSMSKHKGTGATLFNPQRSSRFFEFSTNLPNKENANPGPGTYQQISNLSDQGRYTISKLQGHGKRLFDKTERENAFDFRARKNRNPGPGSYRSPSDFGHYDGNVYSRTGAISYLAPNKSFRASSKAKL